MTENHEPASELSDNDRATIVDVMDQLLAILDASGESLAAAHLSRARHSLSPLP